MRKVWWVIALALLVPFAAGYAQNKGTSQKNTAVTATTTSGNCVATNGFRVGLSLDNSAGSINVGYCFADPATPTTCTAAIGSGGTTTLAAGSIHSWLNAAPQNAICFISASSTQTINAREYQ